MDKFRDRVEEFRKKFDEASALVKDQNALQELRNLFLGRKKGYLSGLFEELKNLGPDEKPRAGQLINSLKTDVEGCVAVLAEKLKTKGKASRESDLTLPGRRRFRGSPHPITLFQQEIEKIFLGMGFSIEDGPEIETDFYNFEALNFPPHHPARDSWDTLYITDDLLLRTHTSPVQVRVMEKRKPPIRI
ncbi:MAG: phenylalanine--tRNA ligase subunit alpha, partial [Acidobacteriota bacterium]|nr:phenylalanine--tRNA ligase subunit alpha [Acidobacteriota bacterium]